MKKHIFNERGDTLIEVVEDTPECGEDFCDRCGDCLSCEGGACCAPTGECVGPHYWVVYQGDEEKE